MQRRCLGCMREYDARYDICPHCGYIYGTQAQSQSFLPPGTVLQGRYLLGKVLGKGGFGITYIAWDQKLEKAVAVKEFLPTAFASRVTGRYDVACFDNDSQQLFDAGLQKMISESRMLAKFAGHSGVVQVFDCVEENGTAYIIMELLRGETVQTLLDREKKLSLPRTMELITPILETLEEIHRTGLVHRDVSPDNLFVCEGQGAGRPDVRLLDFGAARVANGLDHKTLTIVLKKGYAPAEQYSSNGRQGSFTDVYAVSATIYTMLTGVVPPGSLDRMNGDPLPPMRPNADIPPQVEKVIVRGMAIDAEDRIQSAAELQTLLQNAVGKTQKPPKETNEREPSDSGGAAVKKRRILLAVCALALVAGIAAGVLVVRSLLRGRTKGDGLWGSVQVGDAVQFGAYGAGDDPAQPIEWVVLDLNEEGDEALLLSREAIDYRQYHTDSGLSFTWETCEIREWLNTEFYEAAFTESEKEYIVMHTNDNPDNPICLSAGCTDTADRCFLLSMQEVTAYLPQWSDRQANCTSALAARVEDGSDGEIEYVWWALRSPGMEYPAENNMTFTKVDTDGAFWFEDDGLQSVFIRPAIWVNFRRPSGDAKIVWKGAFREHLYDFSWDLQEDTLYLRGSGVMPTPTSAEFESVREQVKAAVIDDGFTTVASGLFMDFTELESVQIPDGVTEIGWGAFRNCPKLQTIRLPASLQRMGASAFHQSGVASNPNYWNGGLFRIGNCLIRANKKVSGKVKIPTGVTVIAQSAFENIGVTEAEIPDGVTRLDYTFRNCTALRSVRIPDSVTSICGAFDYCESLTDVRFPAGLRYLESGFYACESLETIVLPQALKRIGNQAFCCCWALREITVYDNLEIIEDAAFFNCPSLETVRFIGAESEKDAIRIADGNEDFTGAEFICSVREPVTAAAAPYAALSVGDTFTFGSYDRDGSTENGAEPIEWIVLARDEEAGELFVTSKYGLECMPYNEKDAAVTWETCGLRAWLNGKFYDGAFTAEEKDRIVLSTVDNPDNASQKTDGGAQTQDRLFLLSIDETQSLLPEASDRRLVPTQHAIDNGATLVEETQCAWWMLRSPGRTNHLCAIVNSRGELPPFGEMVNQDTGVVRPAMRIRFA